MGGLGMLMPAGTGLVRTPGGGGNELAVLIAAVAAFSAQDASAA